MGTIRRQRADQHKLSLVSLGVQLLWNRRRMRLAAIGFVGICLFYGAVVTYHRTAIGSVA